MVRFLPLCLAGAALAAACGGDDDAVPGDAGALPGVVATGEVRRAMVGARFDELGPIEGATVCGWERPEIPCATTSATGAYELRGLPTNAEIALDVSAEGYRAVLLPLVTDERPIRPSVALEPDAAFAARNAAAGAADDPSSGSIGFVATDATGGLAGVSAEVTPAGDGPYYVDADYAVDTSLAATSSRGFGFVLGIPPGTAVVRFTSSPLACDVPVLGWSDGSGGVRAPVGAAHETSLAVFCGAP